ncbi:MAG: TAXI family TRAP transporter solute-binding subunit [Burkholderiales bacterium]
MPDNAFLPLSRRDLLRTALPFAVAIAAALWVSFHFLQPVPPRRIVLAAGPPGGLYHLHALRYRELLAREGVTVEVRETQGAGQNYALLLDRKSGVDIAFLQGGIAQFPEADRLVMLASLYFEPLWIFYRGDAELTRLNQLRGKRITVGMQGSGTRALVVPLLAANGVGADDATLIEANGEAALDLVAAGRADAALLVGGTSMPLIQRGLRNPAFRLMSFARAEAYERRFPYLSRLTLPGGAVDLVRDIPEQNVSLVATKAMLAAHDDFHPALVNLLLEVVRDVHDDQGYFEKAGEFPGTRQVDLPVSPDAVRHDRFGRSFLYRELPFWVAAFVERTIILVVPLLVVLVPLMNLLPQFVRWRNRSRVYRWYGELALLEREVASQNGPLPVARWLAQLDRIERAVADVKTPPSFASEAYTLREHVAMVRRSVLAKASGADGAPLPG